MVRFLVNPKAVLFHDYLDKLNNYRTIVCNPNTETYIKINPAGYKILKIIDQNPYITFHNIPRIIGISENNVHKFILTMLEQNVILTK